MKKNKTNKKKLWQCKFIERECDDLGKYTWCHCDDNPDRECGEKSLFEMNMCCPYFQKGDRCCFLEFDKYYQNIVKNRKAEIEKQKKEEELKERALLAYLKRKYEK